MRSPAGAVTTQPSAFNGDAAGLEQGVAAEHACGHGDVIQVAAFVICARGALLDVRCPEELDWVPLIIGSP